MKIKLRKQNRKRNNTFYLILTIIITTIILINTIGKKVSNNIITTTKININNIITEGINESITTEYLTNYNINDLITIKYNENEITNIDYNLETTYILLTKIKQNLVQILEQKFQYNNNQITIETPFYNYTNNLFLITIGPTITTKINIYKVIDTNIITNVSNYGINTTKLDIYLNFNITSNILAPLENEQITNNYKVLISSKVINGKVPNYYGNGYKIESDTFNL